MAENWLLVLMVAFLIPHIWKLNTLSLVKAAGTDDQSIISTDVDAKVVLHPPTNITLRLVGPKEAVITWTPPSIYTPHDIDMSQDEEELPSTNGSNSSPSDPSNNLTTKAAEPLQQTTVRDEGKHVNESRVGSVNDDSGDIDAVCHPLRYFFNYTVDYQNNTDQKLGEPKWITMGDIYKKENITVQSDEKIVSFGLGCVREYLVVYSQNQSDPTQAIVQVNASDEPEVYLKNLSPETKYYLYITAVFVSNDTLNSTMINFSTKQASVQKTCTCDFHGTQPSRKGSLACSENATQLCECRAGYVGQFCEMCAPGFYRTAPYFPCHRCPCSAYAAQDQTCKFREGFLTCSKCKEGYSGNICHMCAYGYYRYKQHCIACNCHGNADPESPYMCDVITGACTKCMYNTSGMNCELCKKGYVGDPFMFKNCTLRVLKISTLFESIPEGLIAGICVGVILLLSVIVGCIVYLRWNKNPQNRPFWTVELKDDHEGVNFNTVPNNCDDEVQVVGTKVTMDDLEFYEKQSSSGHSRSSGYARLQENV